MVAADRGGCVSSYGSPWILGDGRGLSTWKEHSWVDPEHGFFQRWFVVAPRTKAAYRQQPLNVKPRRSVSKGSKNCIEPNALFEI